MKNIRVFVMDLRLVRMGSILLIEQVQKIFNTRIMHTTVINGHFCLGIIYTRSEVDKLEETRRYTVDEVENIPAVIHNFLFFAEEKWRIASDKGGSGNTANIGSIQKIDDILSGNGVFAKAGEELFDDYWANFGKIEILAENGKYKKLSSFSEYLKYRGLPMDLNNPKASKVKGGRKLGK